MADLVYTIVETDPASRRAASRVRALVEERTLAGNRVIVELGSVLSISEPYADELFGVLVARYGLDWFADHITLRGASPTVFRSIANAIRHRLESQSPSDPDIALLTARKVLEARQQSSPVSRRKK